MGTGGQGASSTAHRGLGSCSHARGLKTGWLGWGRGAGGAGSRLGLFSGFSATFLGFWRCRGDPEASLGSWSKRGLDLTPSSLGSVLPMPAWGPLRSGRPSSAEGWDGGGHMEWAVLGTSEPALGAQLTSWGGCWGEGGGQGAGAPHPPPGLCVPRQRAVCGLVLSGLAGPPGLPSVLPTCLAICLSLFSPSCGCAAAAWRGSEASHCRLTSYLGSKGRERDLDAHHTSPLPRLSHGGARGSLE